LGRNLSSAWSDAAAAIKISLRRILVKRRIK